jgi:hypothetical protein
MGKLLLILIVLIFPQYSCGQGFDEYTFQDIRLRIKIPDNYSIEDEFPTPNFVDASGKQITDTTKLSELEYNLLKGLLVVSTPDNLNIVSFNLSRQTTSTGNFEEYYEFSKNMQEFMAKQQMTNYKTASSVLNVDTIKVHKFMTFSTNTNPIQYSGVYLANVNNYFLILKSDYIDKEFGERIEQAILTSKLY